VRLEPRYAAMSSVRLLFLPACAAVLLGGCSSTPPLKSEPQRAGAEQSATVMQTLPPPAQNRQYDPGIAPDNEEKGQRVGTIVTTKGGQKTQQDKEKEERATLDKEQARQRADQVRQQNADDRTSSP
jgi:hypothetical protein